jgi:hypothetical protein
MQAGTVYAQLNAPFGAFATATLSASTHALASGSSADDSAYASTEAAIAGLTDRRDQIAVQLRAVLDGAAFGDGSVDPAQLQELLTRAQALIDEATVLAGR